MAVAVRRLAIQHRETEMEEPKSRAEAKPSGTTHERVRPGVMEGNERRRLSLKKDRGGKGSEPGDDRASGSESGVSRMDIKRAPKGKKKRNIYIGLGAVALLVVTFLLSQLEPAAPTVDRNVIVQGTVERGEMVREVRGSGTLVPGGVSFREAHLLMEYCADDGRLTSMEVVELNPFLDHKNISAERALQLILSAMGKSIL